MPASSKSSALRILGWIVITACGALLLLELRPQAISSCLFRRAVGIPCPGCGLSRALLALLHGDWSEVERLHPMAPLLALEWVAVGAGLPLSAPRLEKLILLNAALLFLLWSGRIYFRALPW